MKTIYYTVLTILLLNNYMHSQNSDCMNIGVGLEGPAYWATGDKPFIDQMKFTSDFFAFFDGHWDDKVMDLIPVDKNGYPTVALPHTTEVSGVGMKDISCKKIIATSSRLGFKKYVFLYEGVGAFQFSGFSIDSKAQGRIELTSTSNNNIWMTVLSSEAAPNHPRNFRLIPLEAELTYESDIFYAPFIEKLSNFHTVRFMDWFMTNNSPMIYWEDRTTTNYNSQALKSGIAYEYAVDLCNKVNINPWVCVPHEVDDNYITEMATLFRDGLNEDLDIYVEYSNEIWNWQFDQAHWVDNQAAYTTRPNSLHDATKHYGYNGGLQAKRTFKIWRAVFGADSLRVKRVLANQGRYTEIAKQNINACGDYFDYLSPAWYFGTDPSYNHTTSTTAEDIVTDTRNQFYNENLTPLKAHYLMAEQHGKGIVHYEGGQHITAFGNSNYVALQAFYDAQYLPSMYDLYDEVIDTIRSLGTELAVAFQLSGDQEGIHGSWGHISSVDIEPTLESAPKFMALLDNLPSEENCISANNSLEEANNLVQLYPNPSSNIVNIITEYNELIDHIKVVDQFGETVFQTKTSNGQLNISNLVPGVYIIELKYNNTIARRKILKL